MFDFDIFLSHAAVDATQADEVRATLKDKYRVYCDRHDDKILDRSKASRETAERLRQRMRTCNAMLYVMTKRAVDSKWMPWELGFFDGVRGKVLVYPVDQAALDAAKEQEYLRLFTILKPDSLEEQLLPQLDRVEPSVLETLFKEAQEAIAALMNPDFFGPADQVATVEYGDRIRKAAGTPSDLMRVNREIFIAWLRLWALVK